jgi:hypothetical protein
MVYEALALAVATEADAKRLLAMEATEAAEATTEDDEALDWFDDGPDTEEHVAQ